jgi:predicted transcriptional regulator
MSEQTNKRRDRLEIIYSILKVIQKHHNKIKPTPLLRYSNVSSQSFQGYYSDLLEKELVQEEFDKKDRKHISLTEKGYSYLEKYSVILDFIDEFEL